MSLDQLSMFGTARWITYDLPDATVRLLTGFIGDDEGRKLLALLMDQINWRQDTIRFYGKVHPLPRLQQWFGAPGHVYKWSGIEMVPVPWPPVLSRVRERVEATTGASFNTVLANLYRDGSDTVSWHADDERELGPDPTIASVSLGAEREFLMRHNTDPAFANVSIPLPHGSLLVMSNGSQRNWQHALPRRKRVSGPRLNLTFRFRHT